MRARGVGWSGFVLIAVGQFLGAACSNTQTSLGDTGGTTVQRDASAQQPDATPSDGPSTDSSGGDGPVDGTDVWVPPLCNPSRSWTVQQPAAPTWAQSLGHFGGISSDELTAAWTSTSGSSTSVWIAQRAHRAQAFGTPLLVPTATTPVADDRVALDPTGTLLIAVQADQSTLVAFGLDGDAGMWSTLGTAQFANLSAGAMDTGKAFSTPVLGADGRSLYYVLAPQADASPQDAPRLYESTWDETAQKWGNGVWHSEFTKALPTGASLDGRTLFFFDQTQNIERGGWRDSAQAPFVEFHDVGMLPEAAPNLLCDTLYFRTAGMDLDSAR
jgi:hypothetical protein